MHSQIDSYLSPRIFVLAIALATGCADSQAPTAEQIQTPAAEAAIIDDGLVEALAAKYDPRTLYVMGNAYATGDDVEKDQNIAERLWQVSCDKGHAFACSIYGSRMLEQKDYDEAARTLTLAAEAGVTDAISNLIELHDSSVWPGASVEESVRWYEALQLLQNQDEPSQSGI